MSLLYYKEPSTTVPAKSQCLPTAEQPYCHLVARKTEGGSFTGKRQRKSNYHSDLRRTC